MRFVLIPTAAAVLLLASCAKKDATLTPTDGPHAKVTLKDGSFLMGRVLETNASQITLAGDDNQRHTVATSQMRSLEYDDAPMTQAAPPPAMSQSTPPQALPMAQTPPQTPPQTPSQPSNEPAPAPRDSVPPQFDHTDHYHPREADIKTTTFVIPSGTAVPVRVEETIDSARASEGQTFAAEITRSVLDRNGAVVIPRGSNATVVIRSAKAGGRFAGQSDLVLDLESVSIDGRRYQVSTEEIVEKGREGVGGNKRTAIFTGGGGAFGAIVGALAGGGKGAAIGALSGAGAGAATQMLTKGKAIRVPAETVLTFRLDRPLRIQKAR